MPSSTLNTASQRTNRACKFFMKKIKYPLTMRWVNFLFVLHIIFGRYFKTHALINSKDIFDCVREFRRYILNVFVWTFTRTRVNVEMFIVNNTNLLILRLPRKKIVQLIFNRSLTFFRKGLAVFINK